MRRRAGDVATVGDQFTERKLELKAGYRAGETSRLRPRIRDVAPSGSNADYHYRNANKFYYMMELARHLDRQDPIFGALISRWLTIVLNGGLNLQMETGIDEIDDYLEERFEKDCDKPDRIHSEREHNFRTIEKSVLRSVGVDGDQVIVPRSNRRIQLFEAHRLRSSTGTQRDVVHGVEQNEEGERTFYWLTRNDLGFEPTIKYTDISRVAARDQYDQRQVWHIYHPKRLSQRRGVTLAAPISDPLGILDDVQFAKLIQQQAASAVALVHQFAKDTTPKPPSIHGEQLIESTAGGYRKVLEGLGVGLEIWGQPGETIQGFSPNIPNPEYFMHVTMILTIISMNVGIPLQVLLMDPTKTNFSGWRGALDMARESAEDWQTWYSGAFHKPWWSWNIRSRLATDDKLREMFRKNDFDFANPYSEANERFFEHCWRAKPWRYIQPKEDISTRLMEVERNVVPPRVDASKRGEDFYQNTEWIVQDRMFAYEQAIDAAVKLNQKIKKLGEDGESLSPFDWRDFYVVNPPASISQNQNVDRSQEQQSSDSEDDTETATEPTESQR
jgi:capsid protein